MLKEMRPAEPARPRHRVKAVFNKGHGGGGQRVGLMVPCPACARDGCEPMHAIALSPPVDGAWRFNEDLECPTIRPSIRVRMYDGDHVSRECHGTVTDGWWRFHEDSTHALAGQTVEVPLIDSHC